MLQAADPILVPGDRADARSAPALGLRRGRPDVQRNKTDIERRLSALVAFRREGKKS
jgi:hypothetical protein